MDKEDKASDFCTFVTVHVTVQAVQGVDIGISASVCDVLVITEI